MKIHMLITSSMAGKFCGQWGLCNNSLLLITKHQTCWSPTAADHLFLSWKISYVALEGFATTCSRFLCQFLFLFILKTGQCFSWRWLYESNSVNCCLCTIHDMSWKSWSCLVSWPWNIFEIWKIIPLFLLYWLCIWY